MSVLQRNLPLLKLGRWLALWECLFSPDERLTTVSAHQILQGNNVNAKDRKLVVDKVAAAVMLQSWLDAQKQNLIDG